MTPLQFLIGVLLSASTLSLGIPNEFLGNGSSLLGLAALVPLYRSLLVSKSWRSAGLAGGLMMALVHLLSSFWLAYFKEFAIFTLGASTLANFGMGILAGWVLRWALLKPKWARPFMFAAAWTTWEWFKSIGFLAYPWGTLVMTSRDIVPLIQIADITGAWGISFLFALVNANLAEISLSDLTLPASIFRDARAGRKTATLSRVFRLTGARTFAFTASLITLACAYGTYRLANADDPETTLSVTLVQHNADSWDSGSELCVLESQRLTREALAARETKPDLVIWSESVIPWPWEQYCGYYKRYPETDPLVPFLAEICVPLVSGAPVLVDSVNKGYSNSMIYLSPGGTIKGWYAKSQLVPFAEYMPFTEYAWVRKFFDTLVGFSSGWVPGTEYKSFPVTNAEGINIRFAAPICFEDAFAGVVANLHATGSDVLLNLTNDSWSKTASAELQHFYVASFRAIELRTTLIRSTNAGYTCVIDPTGAVLADLPLFVPAYLNADVPIYPRVTTFYARFRDWFPASAALALAIVFLWDLGNGFRNRRKPAFEAGERSEEDTDTDSASAPD